jgi:hypothetical protein
MPFGVKHFNNVIIAVFLISHRAVTKFYSTNPNGSTVDLGSKLTPVKRYVDAALHKNIILKDNRNQSGIYR